jgi:hypothetical protein
MKNSISLFLSFILPLISISQSTYFQQEVNTEISVLLDDKNNTLIGAEKIIYHNNSTSVLDSIVIHLWPNAYKNVDTELAKQKYESGSTVIKYASIQERGYIDSLNFKIDDQKVKWNYFNNHLDIAILYLNKPLKPKQKIVIETPFFVKIPSAQFSRLGHVGQSYQITQWFPKPAVFDGNGWHPLYYLDQGEFYSEFGSYDVKITLPENYVIMATGDLINGEKELEFLNKKAQLTEQKIKKSELPTKDSLGRKDMSFPKSSDKFKTVHFKQNNVHDFAWFADKRYHVLSGEVELPKSKRKVKTWALFTNQEAHLWTKSIEYLNDATNYFSKWVGEYPYNHVTAVDGTISAGGGMEYPNITVIGNSYTAHALETVIIHEVGHNWFYGILGSNERDNAWMDEGMNTYIEIRYMEEKYDGQFMKIPFLKLKDKNIQEATYQFNASRNYDQPLKMGSEYFTEFNYGGMVYAKTGIGFHYLKGYLGEETFDRCMNNYFDLWKFKHPKPSDIREVFEKVSGKKLDWFFNGYINTSIKTDYAFKSLKKINERDYLLKIKNKTGYTSPVLIQSIKNNNDTNEIIEEFWMDGFKKDTSIVISTKNNPDQFVMDINQTTTDFNHSKNTLNTSGLFKTWKPIGFKLIPYDNNSTKNFINWLPILGYNYNNKTMLGLSLYNKSIFAKKTEFLIAPMYSFENRAVFGIGEISQNINTKSIFPKIELGYKIRSFSNQLNASITNDRWLKQELFSEFRIKERKVRYSPTQRLLLRAIKIDDHRSSGNFILPMESVKQTAYYGQFKYSLESKQVLKPKSLELNYTYGYDNENKRSLVSSLQLTGNYHLNYNRNLDAIKVRVFAGYNFNTFDSRYNLYLKGQDGENDYLYDRTYISRNGIYPNTFSQQTSQTHGAFKINCNGSGEWLIASNFLIELPKLPLGFFIDFGAYPYVKNNTNQVELLYNSGLFFNIKVNKKPFLAVYMPLFYSKEIDDSYVFKTQDRFSDIGLLQKITFVLNLNEINPFTIIKNIKP